MKKIVGIVAVLLLMTGCQEAREMAPDDVQEEPSYAMKSDENEE